MSVPMPPTRVTSSVATYYMTGTSGAGEETHKTVNRAYLLNDSDPLQTEHIVHIVNAACPCSCCATHAPTHIKTCLHVKKCNLCFGNSFIAPLLLHSTDLLAPPWGSHPKNLPRGGVNHVAEAFLRFRVTRARFFQGIARFP